MSPPRLPSVLLPERIALDKIWGGVVLANRLGIDRSRLGETWDCFDRGPDASARIRNYGGARLHAIVEKSREALLGVALPDEFGRFPLMLKLLDATQRLSLQVHPDDELARSLDVGDTGKTEAWVVLEARSGAELVRGFHGSAECLVDAARQGRVEESMLEHVFAHRGDVIEIPPGTVHAVGAGNVLYEIQQNSDITLRLYDWGRVGDDGRPREVHLDAGLRAISLRSNGSETPTSNERQVAEGVELVVRNPCFELRRIALDRARRLDLGGSCALVTPIDGAIRVGDIDLGALTTGIVCAAAGRISIRPVARDTATVLVATPRIAVPSVE
ncbi:MAG: hypothetical protein H6832_14255 [Planctomycetes bacterium]|nr:hypothetical protein [Planctomycetota bacterium]MCB9919561.1 hypothetical protein [Planctomycetota bacterium]